MKQFTLFSEPIWGDNQFDLTLCSHRTVQYFCSVHMELTKQLESFQHTPAQQKFRRLWCWHRDGQIRPYKNLDGYSVHITLLKFSAIVRLKTDHGFDVQNFEQIS